MRMKKFLTSAGLGLLLTLVLAIACLATGFAQAPKQQKKALPSNFVGAEKCKNCHQAKRTGDQFAKWKETKHAKAYEILASDEAKKTAKKLGIEDPQKSDKCLKCHVTAFTEPASQLAKGFDPKQGVQCESCHGPGERHFKARFAAAAEEEEGDGFGEEKEKAYKPVPEGEIITKPSLKTCLGCHNEESPQFKPFCFKKRFAEIQHLDPRKPRSAEELEALKCTCGEKCECKQGECGDLPEKKK